MRQATLTAVVVVTVGLIATGARAAAPQANLVPVKLPHTVNGIYFAGNEKADMGDGYALPGEAVKSGTYAGIPFEIASGEKLNMLRPTDKKWRRSIYGKNYREKHIKLPANTSALYLLAAASRIPLSDNKLALLIGARTFTMVKVPYWDEKEPEGEAKPGLALRSVYQDGRPVDRRCTFWVVRIPMNPSVYGGSQFAPIYFPEMGLHTGVNILAATAEVASVSLAWDKRPESFNFGLRSVPASVKVENRGAQSRSLKLEVVVEDFWGERRSRTMPLSLAPGAAATQELGLSFPKNGFHYLYVHLTDEENQELAALHHRLCVFPHLSWQTDIHLMPNSGPGPLGTELGAKYTDRDGKKALFQAATGWSNGEAELTHHDPSRLATLVKARYLEAKEASPDHRVMMYGASGPDSHWWERLNENGAWGYFDGVWLELILNPRAPENRIGYWTIWAIDYWRKLLHKFGKGEIKVQSRINGANTPYYGEPGIGICWSDQGLDDKLFAKYMARSLILMGTFSDHLILTDSWPRQFNARWWDSWGMMEREGPHSRVQLGVTAVHQLDGAEFAGFLDLGEENFGLLYRKKGKLLVCLWNAVVLPSKVSLPASAEVRIIDAVYSERTVSPQNGRVELELTSSPIYVYGLDEAITEMVKAEDLGPQAPARPASLDEMRVFIGLYGEHDKKSVPGTTSVAQARQKVVHVLKPGQPSAKGQFFLQVFNYSSQPVAGQVTLSPPEGWKVEPRTIDVSAAAKARFRYVLARRGMGRPLPPDKQDPGTKHELVLTPAADAKPGAYRMSAKGTLNGKPVGPVWLDYLYIPEPEKAIDYRLAPAPAPVVVDGSLSEWDGLPVYPMPRYVLDGERFEGTFLCGNYVYHWPNPDYRASARFSYDSKYLYLGMDVDDPCVTCELPAVYTFSGILDHADDHLLIIDASNTGQPEPGKAQAFVFFPTGPRDYPYLGQHADPFPSIVDATYSINRINFPGSPKRLAVDNGCPNGFTCYRGTFPLDRVLYAVKMKEGETGYQVEMGIPLKELGLDLSIAEEVSIQLWSTDATDQLLYYYQWFKGQGSLKTDRFRIVKGKLLDPPSDRARFEVRKPAGDYVAVKVASDVKTCGLVGPMSEMIGRWGDPGSFRHPDHRRAEQVFFSGSGEISYVFETKGAPKGAKRFLLGAELSSEFPGPEGFSYLWPSEITISINGVEAGVFLAPGDVVSGWWVETVVSDEGTYIHGQKASERTLSDYRLAPGRPVSVRFEIKKDAKYPNGLNIYSARTGKHGKDPLVAFLY